MTHTANGWNARECSCGQTFSSPRGRLLHQHAESRKSRTCGKCGAYSSRENRVRDRLCEFCSEDEAARINDLY